MTNSPSLPRPLAARSALRALLPGLLALGLPACSEDAQTCDAECGPLVTVSGDALPFAGSNTARIEGAVISVLERPDLSVTTGPDGHFVFELPAGTEVTLVLEHADYHLIQTGTHLVPEAGIERLTFQAPTHGIFNSLAGLLGITPDEEHLCQMVTTVTRVGKSIYDPGAHGQAGATVTIDPPLSPEQGPVYFDENVLPDRSRTETSDDGGVLFVQVEPGEYDWTASIPGMDIRPIKMKCRPGVLVNASPPWGLQVLP
ncbi:MAG: hypothetical protein IT372_09345 [Polyangiaceae bacterium]|nr:hypothetical protein [Polyangiaceae bacterium]